MTTTKIYSGVSTGENIMRDFVASHKVYITRKVQINFNNWLRDQKESPALYQVEDWFLDAIEEIL